MMNGPVAGTFSRPRTCGRNSSRNSGRRTKPGDEVDHAALPLLGLSVPAADGRRHGWPRAFSRTGPGGRIGQRAYRRAGAGGQASRMIARIVVGQLGRCRAADSVIDPRDVADLAVRVARDVRQQVEGHLVAAAGQQHQDALGLLDRRPGWPSRPGAARPRPPAPGPARTSDSGRAAAGDVDAHALDRGHPAAGSSCGSPTRTTVRVWPSALTIRISSANARPVVQAAVSASSVRARSSGCWWCRSASVHGLGRARVQPVGARTSPATTTRSWCAGRSGTGRPPAIRRPAPRRSRGDLRQRRGPRRRGRGQPRSGGRRRGVGRRGGPGRTSPSPSSGACRPCRQDGGALHRPADPPARRGRPLRISGRYVSDRAARRSERRRRRRLHGRGARRRGVASSPVVQPGRPFAQGGARPESRPVASAVPRIGGHAPARPLRRRRPADRHLRQQPGAAPAVRAGDRLRRGAAPARARHVRQHGGGRRRGAGGQPDRRRRPDLRHRLPGRRRRGRRRLRGEPDADAARPAGRRAGGGGHRGGLPVGARPLRRAPARVPGAGGRRRRPRASRCRSRPPAWRRAACSTRWTT